MVMHILGVKIGMTFSGGFIDLFLFGILQGTAKTNWIMVPVVGLVYFAVYYFLFRFIITKMNLKTPGREDEGEETKLYTRADVNARNAQNASDSVSALILKGLGGKSNISDVDCCATRLRITVKEGAKVDEGLLKQSGAAGVIKKGNGIQAVYGPKADVLKSDINDKL